MQIRGAFLSEIEPGPYWPGHAEEGQGERGQRAGPAP